MSTTRRNKGTGTGSPKKDSRNIRSSKSTNKAKKQQKKKHQDSLAPLPSPVNCPNPKKLSPVREDTRKLLPVRDNTSCWNTNSSTTSNTLNIL